MFSALLPLPFSAGVGFGRQHGVLARNERQPAEAAPRGVCPLAV